MSGASRYTRAISAEVGEIERRLRGIESTLASLSERASVGARDTAEGMGETIASALSDWAGRFGQSARLIGNRSTVLRKDASQLGSVALNRLADEAARQPLLTLAIAVGVGILIGTAVRTSH
jgi:hypothetical protein